MYIVTEVTILKSKTLFILFTLSLLLSSLNALAITGDVVYGTSEYSKHWETLDPVNPTIFIIEDGNFGINEVWINVNTEAEQSSIRIVQLADKPVMTTELESEGFKFFEFHTSNILKSNTRTSKIIFSVPVSWLEENTVSKESIKLKSYDGLEWETLETRRIDENGVNIKYETDIKIFRQYLAIGGKETVYYDKVQEETEKEEVIAEIVKEQVEEPKFEVGLGTIITIIAIVFIIILITMVKINTKKPKKKHKK